MRKSNESCKRFAASLFGLLLSDPLLVLSMPTILATALAELNVGQAVEKPKPRSSGILVLAITLSGRSGLDMA